MTVSIKENSYGSYQWQSNNSKWYSIQLMQIMPTRYRDMIVENCHGGKIVVFQFFYYDRTNKILMVGNERMI